MSIMVEYASGNAGVEVPLGTFTVGTSTNTTASPLLATSFTFPAAARRARFVMVANAGGSGVVSMGGCILRRKTAGELIVDGTITGTHIQAGTITGDRISANTIEGVHIAANTIRTTSLIVGASAENLVVNPSGREGADGWALHDGSVSGVSLIGNSGWHQAGRWGFWLQKPTTSAQTAWGSRAFPVIPGRKYSVRLFASGAATSSGMYQRMSWKSTRPASGYITASGSDGRDGYTNLLTNGPVVSSPTEYNHVWTAPAGAFWATIVIYNWANGPVSLNFTDVEVKEQITGVSIADGSINADKVETNSLTADKLKASNITVALGVGSSGKITIDGANNRILISD